MPKSFCPTRLSARICHSTRRSWLIRAWLLMMVMPGALTTVVAAQSPAAETPQSTNAAKPARTGEDLQGLAIPIIDPGQAQGLIHIVPFGRGNSDGGIQAQAAPAGAHLTYFGGPVISNVQVVVVFWGPNVNAAITANGTIDQFYADITSSRFYDLLTEYTTAGVTGAPPASTSSNQIIGHGSFGGKFTIAPSVCPGPTACTVTDAQIQSELIRQINASALPAPQSDVHGIINTYYAIYFPPGVTITDGTASSCVIGGFCAYHSNTGNLIPYGVLPDFAAGACSTGCGNGTLFQNVTAVSSHELSEAVTDAQIGSATVFGPPLAWYDGPTPNLGEVADLCGGQDVLVSAGSTTYMIQRNFSNVQGNCVSAPPVFNLVAPSGGVRPGALFSAVLTVQSTVTALALSGYTGTVHFTSSDPQAILPADSTFLPGDAGSHSFAFTLSTLGDQTVTVIDTRSSGFTSTTTINVNTTPDMVVTKSHTGNFTIGQTGAVYTITVSNLGRGPSSGTVTVTDSLPAGLTATAITGTGWSCTLGTLTCTRGDALGVGAVYPPISLTVDVATNTPANVVNIATVSGGGETNTANNVASDPTVVTAPDLTVFTSHSGPINTNIFFQGEPGFYTIAVHNVGTLQTSGTVTFTDSLPAGLNATAISGTGWSCTLGTLTCTRSDALSPNSSYPVITLNVDVPLGAPSSVTNVATISGGGEVNTVNDVFQDFTTISPPRTPDLAIAKFHSGSFIQGQTGVYFINVNNVGTGATSGTVTVTDTLPAGLTATDISGAGWSCILASLTCSRSDVLNFSTGYPQIVLTVNVAANAPASVTNTVTVSGGGDTNAANNNASDFTTIAPAVVDLRLTLFAAGTLSVGDTNQLQVFGVENAGNVPSSGPVTVTVTVTTGITVASISGPGWNCTLSTLTCTRSDSVPPNFNGAPEIDVRLNVALNAPSRVTTTLTVSGGGDSVPGNNTLPFDHNVNGPVTINIFPASASVNAGQTATIPLSVGLAQAAGSVNFSCSGLPAASSCSFNPPSATLTSPSLVTLSITTTARSASVPGLRIPGPGSPMWWMLGLALSALIAAAFGSRARQARSFKPAFAAGMVLILVLAAIAGCGSGGPPPPPPPVIGTPAGTYAISVTGTTPIGANSTTLTLTVR